MRPVESWMLMLQMLCRVSLPCWIFMYATRGLSSLPASLP